jgi:hypothetical protein
MKQTLLSIIQSIAVFLNHIIKLGFSDGIRLFFLNQANEQQLIWKFKSVKYPFHMRGKG